MSIEIITYEDLHLEMWDAFCASASNVSILQTRLFLSYHGDRFKDLSLLIMESDKLIGLFPAAQSLSDASLVVSHPGITYGGLVHQGKLNGNRMILAIEAIAKHYAKLGYKHLHYKPIPFIYSMVPAQDDLYALFRLGAKRARCDLSCCIDLDAQRPVSERRRRGLKKALTSVKLSNDLKYLDDVYSVVTKNLANKHNASPVHSREDLNQLFDRFPQNLMVRSALIDGAVEAGIVLFNSSRVWHAQYIAASDLAYEVSALDAVFEAAIQEARNAGARYFDFGTSNEEGGKVLNDGLYRFKSEFGGGGVAHEFYELEC